MTSHDPRLVPLIVVAQFGDFERVVARVRALRGSDRPTLTNLPPGSLEVDGLAAVLGQVAPNEAVHVFHLIADLDTPTPSDGGADPPPDVASSEQRIAELARSVGAHMTGLHEALRDRYPLIDDRSWIVLRAGPQVSTQERDILGELMVATKGPGPAGALVVTSSSGAALEHTAEEVDAQVADVIHAIANSDIDSKMGSTGQAWAIGVGSVAYRGDRHSAAAVLSIETELRRLVEARSRDAGYEQGRRWFEELGIGPPRRGEQRIDAEAALLETGPAGGSLLAAAGVGLRQLESDLEGVDPGLWAGYISTVFDAAVAPRTSKIAPRSPLVVVLDQLDLNLEHRHAELAVQVEADARRLFTEQRNLPNVENWCEGVRSGIEESIAQLTSERTPNVDSAVMDESFQRLRKAARWLPYSTSTLVRAVLITMMALVLAYAFAPLPQLVASVFSRRLPWLGDDLESNARIWARITAVGVGCLLWLWWEAKWRRVRRLRRRYIQAADQHIRSVVEQHLIAGRVKLLRQLLSLVGLSSDSDGSLRNWVAKSAGAVTGILDTAQTVSEQDVQLGDSRFATAVPSSAETSHLIEALGEQEHDLIREAPLSVIERASLDARTDEIAAAITEKIQLALPGDDVGLHSRWKEAQIDESAASVLSAELWSGMADHLAQHRDAARKHYLIASSAVGDIVAEKLDGMPHVDGRAQSADEHFVANAWITRIPLDGPATPSTPAPSSTDGGEE